MTEPKRITDPSYCHICHKQHEQVMTPFPFNGIDCPYAPRSGSVALSDGRVMPIGATTQLDPDNPFYGKVI